jgi:hypothetical protein
MAISNYTIRNCILGVRCNASWDGMNAIRQGDTFKNKGEIRFCNDCQKEVFECINADELVKNIRLNRGISFIKDNVPSLPMVPDDILRVITLRE